MSDWQKDLNDFNKGFTDSPESRMPQNRLNMQMEMGRRAAGHDESDAKPPPAKGGNIWSGLAGLLGFAGLIIGLLLGANFLDKGWVGVALMIGAAALGLVVGMAPVLMLEWGTRAIYEKFLWRRQGKANNAETLVEFWDAKYGAPPLPALVNAVENNGSAWIMDSKGNFVLKMNNGKKLFVGHEKDEHGNVRQTVRKEGKGSFDEADAHNMMLVHKSLGRTSISLHDANKKNGRMMWAAAKLADIDVEDYQPDRRALELLNEMRSG